MKRRRILCLVLAVALIAGLLGVGSALAAGPVTLHTGGGVIVHSDWRVVDDYTYTGSASTLPTPQMAGATFEGWYTNIGLTEGKKNAGGAATPGTDYYAKWTPIQNAQNDSMKYWLTSSGGSANGFKNGEALKAFFVNGGFYTAYSTEPLPAPGGTAEYSGTPASGLKTGYVNLTGDAYILCVMNLEGGFVRLSYTLTNRGESAVSGLSLGAAGDSQLGGNDYVPLRVVEDGGDTYLEMYDTTAGNMLRLYYKGDKVTDTSRFWYGGYWGSDNKNSTRFTGNTFNNGKDGKYKDGIDSAFAFSWEDIELAAGETKKFSVLLGVGAPGTMEGGCTLSYDANGGAWTAGTPATRSYESGKIVPVTEYVPTREDCTFTGWGFSPNDRGTPYRSDTANNRVAVLGDTVLYAQWTPTPHKATVSLSQDNEPLTGQEVTLVRSGLVRYTLSYDATAAAYVTEAVSGVYHVYINGMDSLTDLTIDKADGSIPVYYRSANVVLTKDDAPWTGQSVALYEHDGINKRYTLEYKNGNYEKGLIPPGTYDVWLNGARVAAMDLSTSVSGKETTTLPYYTASVDLKLDGKAWTAQSVTIGTQKAQFAGGKYTAVVPAGTYEVTRGTDDVLGSVSSAETFTVNYYTVTFHNNTEETKEIVKSGKTVANYPLGGQNDAVHDGWALTVGGAPVTFPYTVTEATDFYALWSKPVVTPGESKVGSDAKKYTFPNLTITGYGSDYKVSSMEITVDSGSVSLLNYGSYSLERSNDGRSIFVLFPELVEVSDVQWLLCRVVFTLGNTAQTVDFTVYAEHVTYS